jgi:hypothetical protein
MLNIIKRIFTKQATTALDTVDIVVTKTGVTVDGYIEPVRKSVLKRFPVVFALLVTFGVTATFLGLERIILKFDILDKYPELILIMGIIILALTGKLYKKLS